MNRLTRIILQNADNMRPWSFSKEVFLVVLILSYTLSSQAKSKNVKSQFGLLQVSLSQVETEIKELIFFLSCEEEFVVSVFDVISGTIKRKHHHSSKRTITTIPTPQPNPIYSRGDVLLFLLNFWCVFFSFIHCSYMSSIYIYSCLLNGHTWVSLRKRQK